MQVSLKLLACYFSMTYQEFKDSLTQATPHQKLTALLSSLWFEGKGDWDKAHAIVQDMHSTEAAWIHAYLHRKEGDSGNAAYWYHRAKKDIPTESLKEEWKNIVMTLLEYNHSGT